MKIRHLLLTACIIAGGRHPAAAQVSIGVGIALPGVRIGINVPAYPNLVAIPGYPVYYAPNLDVNLFFYAGYYWVFVGDRWYFSPWYDGPWSEAGPDAVPYFILRIPAYYYRAPPLWFRGRDLRGPPRWDERFGRVWRERHRDWDRWNPGAAPPRAPLPNYQRSFGGPRYPNVEEQRRLRERYYHYQPQAHPNAEVPRPMRRESPPGPVGRPGSTGGRPPPSGEPRRQTPIYRTAPPAGQPQIERRRGTQRPPEDRGSGRAGRPADRPIRQDQAPRRD
ncbi:MAG: hypothetical protein KGL34_00025, partial [Gammaproteobacteria bacterium]|nr:hypothetical protein [Gammaproteobacteria bacterium]